MMKHKQMYTIHKFSFSFKPVQFQNSVSIIQNQVKKGNQEYFRIWQKTKKLKCIVPNYLPYTSIPDLN